MVSGFSRVSASWRAPVFGGTLPRVVLVLCLRFVSVRLPSFLPLLLRWLFFPLGGLLLYGCIGSLIQQWFHCGLCSVVYLQSSLPLSCRGSVFFLRLRFVRRLSPSVVFLSAFAMESPCLSRVSLLVSSPRSERRLSLLAHLYSFGMGSPFGSSVFYIPLDLDRRITFAIGFCSFRLRSRVRCFCLPLVFLG